MSTQEAIVIIVVLCATSLILLGHVTVCTLTLLRAIHRLETKLDALRRECEAREPEDAASQETEQRPQ